MSSCILHCFPSHRLQLYECIYSYSRYGSKNFSSSHTFRPSTSHPKQLRTDLEATCESLIICFRRSSSTTILCSWLRLRKTYMLVSIIISIFGIECPPVSVQLCRLATRPTAMYPTPHVTISAASVRVTKIAVVRGSRSALAGVKH